MTIPTRPLWEPLSEYDEGGVTVIVSPHLPRQDVAVMIAGRLFVPPRMTAEMRKLPAGEAMGLVVPRKENG